MTTAVVFAYHNVGVRCLSVLLANNIDVKLVVTHEDAPGENIWFGSVAALAREHGIPVIAPADPHEPKAFARIKAANPEYLFSFYYRHMLKPAMLQLGRHGAFNMHGSLLPKYRGRVPINWAIIYGERETGASLHEMVEKPDAGRLVDQQAVPILPNDTAREVFDKVTVAAEIVLARSLPPLLAGVVKLKDLDLKKGSYFSGRKPEDGRISWRQPAVAIHDLVRALTHPYPGAFTDLPVGRVHIWRTQPTMRDADGDPALFTDGAELLARCGDRRLLRILSADLDGQPLDAAAFNARFGGRAMPVRDAALKVHK